VEKTQTPSQEHVEFDRICSQVEEFEHLPTVASPGLEPEPADEGEQTELDQLILAGLVSPA
jgi:hypothetical protein